MHPENIMAGKLFGECHGFMVCTGAHDLRSIIGNNKSKSDWLRECMLTWENNIGTIKKPRENIPRRVLLQWHLQSNQNGYSYKTSPGTQRMHLREWKRWFGKTFCLVFSSEIQNPPHPSNDFWVQCRSRKTDRDSWIQWIQRRKSTQVLSRESGNSSDRDGGKIILKLRQPPGAQRRKAWQEGKTGMTQTAPQSRD